MTVIRVKNSAQELQESIKPFFKALHVFIESIQSVRELNGFIDTNEHALIGVEDQFIAESRIRFPSTPVEFHRKVATLIQSKVSEFSAVAKNMEDTGSTREEVDDYRRKAGDLLDREVNSLTESRKRSAQYAKIWNAVSTRKSGAHILRASLLISVVSEFEVLVSAVVRAAISSQPAILRSSGQQYTMQDIDSYESLEDFRRACGEKLADELLFGGFDKWMNWFSKQGVRIEGVSETNPELVEVFQRRHLLVHTGGVVNSIYLNKTKGITSLEKVGDTLRINSSYLRNATGALLKAGIMLTVGATQKFTGKHDPDSLIEKESESATFQLLLRGEHSVVESLNSWILTFAQDPHIRTMLKANLWLTRKRLQGIDAIRSEIEAWDTAGGKKYYELMRLSLLERTEEARLLAISLLEKGDLDEDDWQHWPVFEVARESFPNSEDETIEANLWSFDR
ncbi:hypothetical protein [Rhodococcus sp. 5G237]